MMLGYFTLGETIFTPYLLFCQFFYVVSYSYILCNALYILSLLMVYQRFHQKGSGGECTVYTLNIRSLNY